MLTICNYGYVVLFCLCDMEKWKVNPRSASCLPPFILLCTFALPPIFLRLSSHVPSLFLRTKVGAKSVQSRWKRGVSSSLVLRKSEGLWEDEQTFNEVVLENGRYWVRAIITTLQKSLNLCESSAIPCILLLYKEKLP